MKAKEERSQPIPGRSKLPPVPTKGFKAVNKQVKPGKSVLPKK